MVRATAAVGTIGAQATIMDVAADTAATGTPKLAENREALASENTGTANPVAMSRSEAAAMAAITVVMAIGTAAAQS
jgi:hypothetical protein